MRRRFHAALTTLLLLGASSKALAFSMIGPLAGWMSSDIGYNLPITTAALNADIGGPMNLTEEYRWNSPVITYSFDRSFEDYFGTAGIEAVEAAIKVLNDLPHVSTLSEDLSEYPLSVARINNTATELRLLDMKTMVLSMLLEHLGLAAPERYAWTLRARRPTLVPDVFTYAVIQRNFDPITFEPTSYVNGTRYTYRIRRSLVPDYSEAVEVELDPTVPNLSVVGITGVQAGNTFGITRGQRVYKSLGLYADGLTRDDVGGLRYLYHPENVNVETVPSDAVGDSSGGFTPGGSSTQDNSPWGLPGGVFGGLTNATAAVVNTNSTFAYFGARPGVGKVEFRRIPRSTVTNQVYMVRYQETVINESQGRITRQLQTVTRVVQTPDINFVATDLDIFPNVAAAYAYSRNPQFSNNSSANSSSGANTVGPGTIGPGVSNAGAATVFPQMQIQLSKIGLWNFHINNTSEEDRLLGFDILTGFAWGTFDGSTNTPTIFPNSLSMKEMERRIFGR